MKQNVTLSLDRELLSKLRVIAAQRATSVSGMLAEELTAIVERSERYEQSKRVAMSALDEGLHLGGRPASRDELHER